MDGPWVKYQRQSAPAEGPWTKYQQPARPPNPFDQFDTPSTNPPPASDPSRMSDAELMRALGRSTSAGPKAPADMSDDELMAALRTQPTPTQLGLKPPAQPGVTEDMARGFEGGATRGAVGLLGLPGFAAWGVDQLADWAVKQSVGRAVNKARGRGWTADDQPYQPIAPFGVPSPAQALPTPDQVVSSYEKSEGPTYRPKTTPGSYAASVGEMAGSGARAVPALAAGLLSEAGGQITKGTAAEPYARAGGALVGGISASLGQRPGTAAQIVQRDAGGMSSAQVDAVEALMRDAQSAGLPLTRAEAAQAVTNGATNLGSLQRLVEGRGDLRQFMAERPAQVEAAGRRAFDDIAPQAPNPSMIGPQVGRAAEQEVQAVQRGINDATRPLYQQAEQVRVGPQVHQALLTDPLYARTLQEVRNNPALNRGLEHMADDAVGVVDMVQRRMREQSDALAVPGQTHSSNTAAAAYTDARQAPIAAAEAATGSRPGVQGSYEAARAQQEALRAQHLDPLMAGPIGKLAQRDITTQNAVNALFPKNPTPGSAQEVLDSVTALSARAPEASRRLVRAHVESQFNRATQDLQGGANQWGGANFAKAIRGNEQEAANLAASIRGLPNGQQVLEGFDRMLDIMAATGRRMQPGSPTAEKGLGYADLSRGGAMRAAGEALTSAGTSLPKRVREAFEQWNLGNNTTEIARILTDPAAAPLFRHLATAEAGAARTNALLSRLVSMASTAGTTSVERSKGPGR